MADHNSEATDYMNTEDFYSKLSCWKDKKSMAVAPAIKTIDNDKDKTMDSQIKLLKKRADDSSSKLVSKER